MRNPSRRVAVLLALLALPLTVGSSCNRRPNATPQGAAKGTPAPLVRNTPVPIPPTPTLRPGQPTPLPVLPG